MDNRSMRKKGTDNATYFRAGDRVFCLNGEWYFQTREDTHGPFPSRQTAEDDMDRYVKEMCYFDKPSRKEKNNTQPVDGDVKLTLVDKDYPEEA